ncbi:glycoside hydrolase family 88 protein [Mucilaginibacter sp. PAMB04168]|uniref:glycoside hydrolase family 88 protein n=1 Tax=Mucilaginibacter sp. PAMB04168 TaxID=3138567 RepID=UPI0031F64473
MKLKILITAAIAACSFHLQAQTVALKPKADLVKLINKNLKDANAQYKVLMTNVPKDSLPETFQNNRSKSTSAKNWVSGFYPGTLFYLYKGTKEPAMYTAGLEKLPVMEPMKTIDSHDIGFMMYCSFGNANQIKPSAAYKDVLLTSAQSLSKRFNPKVGCTMSWSSKPGEFRVIIDNMMNLELLMWATKVSGDSSYAKIAISHANTTMKNHFRPDYSSYHLVNYNPETGGINKKQTVQGYADSSAWARGQGWGLYGFTMMYRETKDKKYLNQAKNIANFILSHRNLPADKVPYWDFNAPDIPNAYRDASAGAIYASALIELAGYVDAVNAKKYINVAETIIRTLSSDKFKAAPGENGGFILKHSVGHLPKGAMIDVPLTYADYYFVEAMLRYKNLGKK